MKPLDVVEHDLSHKLAGLAKLSRVLEVYNERLRKLNEEYPNGGGVYEVRLRKLDIWFKDALNGREIE